MVVQTKASLHKLFEEIFVRICELPEINEDPHFIAFLNMKKKTKSQQVDSVWGEEKKIPIYLDIMSKKKKISFLFFFLIFFFLFSC